MRTFKPKNYKQNQTRRGHLDAIRKALVRGELRLNGLNRWRLLEPNKPAVGWTFVDASEIKERTALEISIACREYEGINYMDVDDASVAEKLEQIEIESLAPDLIIAQRNWRLHPNPIPAFSQLIDSGRRRGSVVHIIAALSESLSDKDELYREALRRYELESNPLSQLSPQISNIERQFGESLSSAGLDPIPQKTVGNYYLDFGVIDESNHLPVRLDVEVDGRYWHEELPGRRRPSDLKRDRIMKILGWRPVRFWTDEIEKNEEGCIQHIVDELFKA